MLTAKESGKAGTIICILPLIYPMSSLDCFYLIENLCKHHLYCVIFVCLFETVSLYNPLAGLELAVYARLALNSLVVLYCLGNVFLRDESHFFLSKVN